jgi:transcriptional regulator with XRE-family HTH domain
MRGDPESTSSRSAGFLRYPAGVRWTPQKIKDRRRDAGLSQKDLAELLGVSLRSITSWEIGEAAPRNLTALDTALGQPGEDTEPTPPATGLADATPIELVSALLTKIHDLERENLELRHRLDTRADERSLGVEEGPVPPELWDDPELVEGKPRRDEPGEPPARVAT